jgi:hypothetical protein
MSPSGGQYQPGQKFGIFGSGGSDLNIHHSFLFSHRLACSILWANEKLLLLNIEYRSRPPARRSYTSERM